MSEGPLSAVLHHVHKLLGTDPAASLSDHQQLERFLSQREEAAFAALVLRHGPVVQGVCRRMLANEHDAEDVFQATFLVLARRAGSIRRRQSVAAWLHGVAYRLALKTRLRSARQAQVAQQAALRPPPLGDQPLEQAARREMQQILDEELHALPEKERLPLILCYLQGKTHEEAAAQLGCPRGSLAKRLAQAQGRLERRLVRRGLAVSTGTLAASAELVAAVPADRLATAAGLFAAGQAVSAELVSSQAVVLAKGMLRIMFLARISFTAVAILSLGLLTAGVGHWAFSTQAAEPAKPSLPAPTADKPAEHPADKNAWKPGGAVNGDTVDT